MPNILTAVLASALIYPPPGAGAGQPRFGSGQPRLGGPAQPFGQGRPQFGGARPVGTLGAPNQRFGGGTGDRSFGRDGRRRHGYGAAVGAGVAGFAAGALIGGALSNRNGYDSDYDRDYRYAAPLDRAPQDAELDGYEEVTPTDADDPAACARRYRSYDPDSQTYLGYDGERHPCP